MPNWAYNSVQFKHADKTMIDRMVEAASENGKGVLSEFVPVPQELMDTMAGFYGKGDPRQAELEAKQLANKVKYGYANWYDFCNAEWGTKWDVCDVDSHRSDDNTITLSFNTAWSPPFAFFEKMVELGFDVRAMYTEEQNIWAGIWDNGVDEFYEYRTAEDAREILPAELDEMFNIIEQCEERDAENVE